MCMHQDPICMFSWICVHCSMFKCVLNSVLAFLGKFSEYLFSLVFHNCKDSVYNSFSLPSLFRLTCSVWRVSAFYSCTICDGGSRQGCQDLLAMGGTPFKEVGKWLSIVEAPEYLIHPTSTSQWIVNYKWDKWWLAAANGALICWRPSLL